MIKFVQKLRIKMENQPLPPKKLFSFYNKDSQKWEKRIIENNNKAIQGCINKGVVPGPRMKTIFDIMDLDSSGNIGSIEHLMTPISDKSLIGFAFGLRKYSNKYLKPIPKPIKIKEHHSKLIIKDNIKPENCFEKWNRLHPPLNPISPKPWYEALIYPEHLEASLNTSGEFVDKFPDRNIANYKMHFSPKNGKDQIGRAHV